MPGVVVLLSVLLLAWRREGDDKEQRGSARGGLGPEEVGWVVWAGLPGGFFFSFFFFAREK